MGARDEMQEDGKFFEMAQLGDHKAQPRADHVWRVTAWNVSTISRLNLMALGEWMSGGIGSNVA